MKDRMVVSTSHGRGGGHLFVCACHKCRDLRVSISCNNIMV